MITRQVDDIHHLVNEFSLSQECLLQIKIININNIITDYIKPLISSFDDVTIEIDKILKIL